MNHKFVCLVLLQKVSHCWQVCLVRSQMKPCILVLLLLCASITLIVQMNLVKLEVRLCLTDVIQLSLRKNLQRNGVLALTLPS